MRLALLSLLALAPVLSAQDYIDRFDYADGTTIPGWTERQGGDFQILNKQLVMLSGGWSQVTLDKYKNVADCVLDMECFYGSGASTRFAGVTARHDGSTTENGVIMLKVQDNGSSGNFNSLWLYERPGTATSMTNLSPTSKHCVVRMFVKGSTAWFHVDMDMDGYFELRSVVRTFSGAATKPVGMIGANAFGNATMDNFKFYRAMLHPATVGTQPTVGQNFDMVLAAPQNEVGGNKLPTPWIGWLGFKPGELPLPDGRAIPFDIFSSLQLWNGLIDAKNPEGKLTLPIPNDKSFVGARLFVNACTLGMPGAFLTIGAISNPLGVEVQ
jgi:hypothetical protein